MDDVRAVMDAVGSERAALFGASEGGHHVHPVRRHLPRAHRALVLVGSYAKRLWSAGLPLGADAEQRERDIDASSSATGARAGVSSARAQRGRTTRRCRGGSARTSRRSASPGAAAALIRMNTQIDVRDVLPTIRVPTLVLHRDGRSRRAGRGGALHRGADPGREVRRAARETTTCSWTGDTDALLDEVEEFLTGVRRGPDPDRVLATVLFTDIVGSTETASELGDRAWRELLERHHDGGPAGARALPRAARSTRRATASSRPSTARRAPSAARRAIVKAVRDLGLEIRAGLHTGEVEMRRRQVARHRRPHRRARRRAGAGPGEVLVSRTVKDLVAGSGIVFADRGEHALKGVPSRGSCLCRRERLRLSRLPDGSERCGGRAHDRRGPDGGQGQRVPGRRDPGGRARARARRPPGRGAGRRRCGLGAARARLRLSGRRGPGGRRRGLRQRRHDPQGQGAAAAGVRALPRGPAPVHVPPPGGRRGAHAVPRRTHGRGGGVRDRAAARRTAAAAGADVARSPAGWPRTAARATWSGPKADAGC